MAKSGGIKSKKSIATRQKRLVKREAPNKLRIFEVAFKDIIPNDARSSNEFIIFIEKVAGAVTDSLRKEMDAIRDQQRKEMDAIRDQQRKEQEQFLEEQKKFFALLNEYLSTETKQKSGARRQARIPNDFPRRKAVVGREGRISRYSALDQSIPPVSPIESIPPKKPRPHDPGGPIKRNKRSLGKLSR